MDCGEIKSPSVIKKIVNWDKGLEVMVTGLIQDVTFGDLQLSECKFSVDSNK